MKKEKIYIPEGELRGEMIQLHHDTPVGGHGGRWKTAELVARSNKGDGEVYGWMRCMSKIQESKRSTCGKTDAQYNPRKAIEPHLSKLYHQATISPGI